MTTNVLVALKNVLEQRENQLLKVYENKVHNRANNMGDALEYYIKDIFCNTIDLNDFNEKEKRYCDYLSYMGNNNNPPDFIIKQDAAVEVKKLESVGFGYIPLNSSHPKDKLKNESTLISTACKECENDTGGWTEKEMIYAIGNVREYKLRLLWLIYGDCYCATEETYLRVKNTITKGIDTIQGVEFAETNEIGRVNKVDPLGITYLRIRGMWGIEHPMNVFNYLIKDYKRETDYQIYALMLKEKYNALPQEDKDNLDKYLASGELKVYDVEIKDPNNPVKYKDAVLFTASL